MFIYMLYLFELFGLFVYEFIRKFLSFRYILIDPLPVNNAFIVFFI